MNYFEKLNAINVNDITEQKGKLTYLSWAHAWKELKKLYPKSFYTVYENSLEWNYFSDNRYCWVKTGVTVVTDQTEIEHIEYLPVMDYKNASIPANKVTSFDVNKAIQRSLTKAVARHGLGLYIYAGEDLPNESDGTADTREVVEETYDGTADTREVVEETYDGNEKITAAKAKNIDDLVTTTGSDRKAFLEYFKVSDTKELTVMQYAEAVKMLSKKTKKGTIEA